MYKGSDRRKRDKTNLYVVSEYVEKQKVTIVVVVIQVVVIFK